MDATYARSKRSYRGLVVVTMASVGVAISSVAIAVATSSQDSGDLIVSSAFTVAFTVVGALILDRRPGQPVGRICLAIGLLSSTAAALRVGAVVLDAQPGPIAPVGAVIAVIASAMFSTALVVGMPLLISHFPNGATAGWSRRLQALLLIVVGAALLLGTFRPGLLEYGWIEPVDNPLGFAELAVVGSDDFFALAFFGFAAAYLFAGAGLVLRYRRGSSVERAQVRWLAASVAMTLTLLLAVVLTGDDEALNEVAYGAWSLSAFLLPPIAIGIAILRNRLYEIDRIISRTLAYAVLTAVLIGVYAAGIIGIQAGLALFSTSGGPIAVAASTLAVYALFQPLRRRFQTAMDRRFNRSRYDAEQTIDLFATRLRDEVDLGRLGAELRSVVGASLAPATIGIWLREGTR